MTPGDMIVEVGCYHVTPGDMIVGVGVLSCEYYFCVGVVSCQLPIFLACTHSMLECSDSGGRLTCVCTNLVLTMADGTQVQ